VEPPKQADHRPSWHHTAILGTAKSWCSEPYRGDVEALERLENSQGREAVGNIRTARIVIEDGAYFKGSNRYISPSR